MTPRARHSVFPSAMVHQCPSCRGRHCSSAPSEGAQEVQDGGNPQAGRGRRRVSQERVLAWRTWGSSRAEKGHSKPTWGKARGPGSPSVHTEGPAPDPARSARPGVCGEAPQDTQTDGHVHGWLVGVGLEARGGSAHLKECPRASGPQPGPGPWLGITWPQERIEKA